MTDGQDVMHQAARWRREGRGVALATVVATWNASPRPVGAKLAVDDSGHMTGSVSGGCVEGAVVEAALETIRTGKPQVLDFGVADADALQIGLACGGRVRIYVEIVQ